MGVGAIPIEEAAGPDVLADAEPAQLATSCLRHPRLAVGSPLHPVWAKKIEAGPQSPANGVGESARGRHCCCAASREEDARCSRAVCRSATASEMFNY